MNDVIINLLKISEETARAFTQEELELAYIAIGKLRMRFANKIQSEDYYLSYSGGKDSHLLLWFIKDYLHDTQIEIVSVNTFREHNDIRKRLYENCDIVLTPTMKMSEINAQYGMPCFTKTQDEHIHRYNKGLRSKSLMERVARIPRENGYISSFALNKIASELLLNDNLHKVSCKCCDFTKKQPLKNYEQKTHRCAILGVRSAESLQRKAKYKTCLSKNGKFSPIYDFTDCMVDVLYRLYDIEIPSIYYFVDRTGCIGCPYGKKNSVLEGLGQATVAQVKYALDSFGESYKVKGWYGEIVNILRQKENQVQW